MQLDTEPDVVEVGMSVITFDPYRGFVEKYVHDASGKEYDHLPIQMCEAVTLTRGHVLIWARTAFDVAVRDLKQELFERWGYKRDSLTQPYVNQKSNEYIAFSLNHFYSHGEDGMGAGLMQAMHEHLQGQVIPEMRRFADAKLSEKKLAKTRGKRACDLR